MVRAHVDAMCKNRDTSGAGVRGRSERYWKFVVFAIYSAFRGLDFADIVEKNAQWFIEECVISLLTPFVGSHAS